MIEELIRVDHGVFMHAGTQYLFDVSVSKGECVGIFVDNHRTSGTAYMGIFSGTTRPGGGTAFTCGVRTGYVDLQRWIRDWTMVIDKNRFASRELTAGDFVCAIGRDRGRAKGNRPELRNSIFLADHEKLLRTAPSLETADRMGIGFSWDTPLTSLSMLDYYRLTAFRAWLAGAKIVVLDRITEILRRQDLDLFMDSVMLLLEQGAAVVLMDMDENFMFRYAARIDILKNHRLCYRLYPEEYGERLYHILGWNRILPGGGQGTAGPGRRHLSADALSASPFRPDGRPGSPPSGETSRSPAGAPGRDCMVKVSGLEFSGVPPISFSLDRGEIGILQDENYRTGLSVREAFLGPAPGAGDAGWKSGSFFLDGRSYTLKDLRGMVGRQIAIQIEMPDRSGGSLFDNLSALENLSSSLIPKAGKHLMRRQLSESILDEAARWFDRDALLRPIRTWSMPDRLRLTYYKWYLVNPGLLICLFPFLGQESIHREMIIDLIVRCAERGMAVWIISSGISDIRTRTSNRDFLDRLRYLD